MKNKKVIWMLVLCLTLGMAAPAATFADETGTDRQQSIMTLTEAEEETPAVEETTAAPETTETEAPETEAPTEEASEAPTEEEQSQEETVPASTENQPQETGSEFAIPDQLLDPEESESSTEESSSEAETITNEQLIQMQHIEMPEITEMPYEFRFTKDEEAKQGLLMPDSSIYEAPGEDARVVGYSFVGSIVYILADEDQDWVYVESGRVRGFVPRESLATDELVTFILEKGDPTVFADAVAMGSPMYNAAINYTMTTGYEPMAKKVYAIAKSDTVNIYGQKNVFQKDAQIVGTMKKGDLAYILADKGNTIVYVESGDVKGFVLAEDLSTGKKVNKKVKKNGEDSFSVAETTVAVRENPALYYTITSVKEPNADAALRSSLVNFALQFVGNRYVWGGTDLRTGVDCSGFVQQVYQYFGYSLPRVSVEQSTYGKQIPIEAALPGDLIFYAKDGVVFHVSMYIGDGQVVQAYGTDYGIIVSGIGSRAVWATRIIGE